MPVTVGVEEVEGDFEVPSLLNQRHRHVGVLVPEVEDVSDVQRAVLGVEGGVRQSIQVLRKHTTSIVITIAFGPIWSIGRAQKCSEA